MIGPIMTEDGYLANQLLIAMPGMADPNFSDTVTYICEHNRDGALGLVINRPMDINLGEILSHMSLAASTEGIAGLPVFLGGPVQPERGFVLHTQGTVWESSLKVSDDIAVTSSRDILAAIADGEGPARSLVALGYAGWGAGQLEHEIQENTWLHAPPDARVLFETPFEQRWAAATALLGIDPSRLSGTAGHA